MKVDKYFDELNNRWHVSFSQAELRKDEFWNMVADLITTGLVGLAIMLFLVNIFLPEIIMGGL